MFVVAIEASLYVSWHRTTVSNHRKRLPLLFDTWLTKVNTSQVFLVTDGDDPFTRLWTSVKGVARLRIAVGFWGITEPMHV